MVVLGRISGVRVAVRTFQLEVGALTFPDRAFEVHAFAPRVRWWLVMGIVVKAIQYLRLKVLFGSAYPASTTSNTYPRLHG